MSSSALSTEADTRAPVASPAPAVPPAPPGSQAAPHTLAENIAAYVIGAFLMSWGLTLLHAVQGVTGGLAGASFLVSYAGGVPLGAVFFAVNLPFYYFAVRRMGWSFTLRTLAVVGLTSALTPLQQELVTLSGMSPWYAAVFGGLCVGLGMIVVFRHNASGGGFGILALHLQDRYGWRAGYVQLGLDAVVILCALPLVEPGVVLASLAGVAVLNLVIAMNHRPGRYNGR
ncbi:YitT family protein [Streptomyces abyssomicinicus]|uniref:YitT family protein n=1 Tax=Streptomyces abyssomicinicus TaxID=574929 RepID=UPI00124FEFBD|nr:YitT family protein [Streptomyces abyssomicinicus]